MDDTQAPMRAWLRPQHLRHQLLAVVGLVVVCAMLALYAASSWRLQVMAQREAWQWADALARTVAANLVEEFDDGHVRSISRRLADFCRLPGVLRLDVVDLTGRGLQSCRPINGGAQVMMTSRPQDVSLRIDAGWTADVPFDPFEALGHPPSAERANRVQSWATIPGHGHVAVRFDPSLERRHLDVLQSDLIWFVVGIGLLSILVAHHALRQAMLPLQRAVDFAGRLARQVGMQLQVRSSSREVDDLTRALNDASSQLKRQLDATVAAESRTAGVINAAPDALLGLDGDGHVVLINHAVESVLGCTESQILGRTIEHLVPQIRSAADLERMTLEGLYMRASGSHLVRFETTARRHDGTEFPAEVSISRVTSEEGTRYACVVRDLTEPRMTMAMLELYNQALECTTNGIIISDMTLPGQPVFYANPAFARITGYQRWEAIGKKCGDLLQGQDRDQPEIEIMRQALERREAVTVVLRNYRKDGTLFFNELALAPVQASDGMVRHYVGVITDVSERERARLALAERNARLNTVFDLSPDGYAVFDREGELVFGNHALREMTGWDADALAAGMSLAEFDQRFAAQCDPASPWKPLAGLHECGVGSYDTDDLVELQRPQRRTLTRLARLNIDGRGESILYFRDVTREMEVDRMKSEFLTTAAHELRTPMVSVFGFTELLLNRPVPEARRRDVLETIHRQASLLISMVNELLDLARIEARQGKDLKREPLRLAPVLEQAVQSFMVHGDSRRVRMDVRHPDAVMLLDPEKTHRALTNIVSNAFKYSPGGGEVSLDTLDGEVDGQVAVGIRVSDQGIGMTPAQLARVFERFFRADPSGNIPGTGLGMSLVKEIAELQGGRVEVQSTAGVGTQVTLWFPLAEPAAAPAALPAPAAAV